MKRRFRRNRQRRPGPKPQTSSPETLSGKPYSREWLMSLVNSGYCDGFVILDETRAGPIWNGKGLSRDEIERHIISIYGREAKEIVLR